MTKHLMSHARSKDPNKHLVDCKDSALSEQSVCSGPLNVHEGYFEEEQNSLISPKPFLFALCVSLCIKIFLAHLR